MDSKLDLTPFGFTPTESIVYVELLSGGPSSGYAIAKRLGIARANAYQALDGLTAKAAAHVTGDRPKKYRASRPDTVLAQVIDRQSRQIDRLAEQVELSPVVDSEDIVVVEGERAIVDLAMRTAARHDGLIWCIGTPPFLASLAPAWRRRVTDGKATTTWVIGYDDVQSVILEGQIAPNEVKRLFGTDVFMLVGKDAALAAQLGEDTSKGIWSSDPILVGSIKGTIAALTGAGTEPWLGS